MASRKRSNVEAIYIDQIQRQINRSIVKLLTWLSMKWAFNQKELIIVPPGELDAGCLNETGVKPAEFHARIHPC